MEQVQGRASNFSDVGATFTFSEQDWSSWSKTKLDGAISIVMEQVLDSVSNFIGVGATFTISEQDWSSWSKIKLDGAILMIMKQISIRQGDKCLKETFIKIYNKINKFNLIY